MVSLRAAFVNEAMKLASRKKAVFFLILTVLVPVAAAILASRMQSGFGVSTVTAADFPIVVLQILSTFLIPLIIFMCAADLFAGELGDKTMRMAVTRPVARWKVFAAKNAALLLLICVHLAAGLLASLIASGMVKGNVGLAAGFWHAIVAYGTAVVPMLTLAIIAVFISIGFKNGSGAIAVCVLLYAAAKLAAFVFPQLNLYSPTAYTDWYMLWIGGTVAAGKIASTFMFLVACCILFLTAGYIWFDQKEL